MMRQIPAEFRRPLAVLAASLALTGLHSLLKPGLPVPLAGLDPAVLPVAGFLLAVAVWSWGRPDSDRGLYRG